MLSHLVAIYVDALGLGAHEDNPLSKYCRDTCLEFFTTNSLICTLYIICAENQFSRQTMSQYMSGIVHTRYTFVCQKNCDKIKLLTTLYKILPFYVLDNLEGTS